MEQRYFRDNIGWRKIYLDKQTQTIIAVAVWKCRRFIVQSLDTDELFDIKTMQYAEEGNYRGRIFV